jgi:hypothetical protein
MNRVHLLPTLIPDQPDEEVDPFDILMSELSIDLLAQMYRDGTSIQDVLDGKVPGIDPTAIVAEATVRDGPR